MIKIKSFLVFCLILISINILTSQKLQPSRFMKRKRRRTLQWENPHRKASGCRDVPNEPLWLHQLRIWGYQKGSRLLSLRASDTERRKRNLGVRVNRRKFSLALLKKALNALFKVRPSERLLHQNKSVLTCGCDVFAVVGIDLALHDGHR